MTSPSNYDIRTQDHAVDVVTKQRDSVIKRVQKNCSHTNLAECSYKGSDYSSFPPIRICLVCGMTEEGWGCGYIVLTFPKVEPITRDRLYETRRGIIILDSHKGPLLRKEVTVAELIDGDSKL